MCLLERLEAGRKYDVTKRKTGDSMEKIKEISTHHTQKILSYGRSLVSFDDEERQQNQGPTI